MSFEPLDLSQTLVQRLAPLSDFVFLLGSAQTERFNTNSDIDVAVFWKALVTEDQKNQCWKTLEEKTGHDVDLVSLNDTDIIFARQVLETGRLIFCDSGGFLLEWKARVLSAYPDFKASRKIIEDQILTRKKYV